MANENTTGDTIVVPQTHKTTRPCQTTEDASIVSVLSLFVFQLLLPDQPNSQAHAIWFELRIPIERTPRLRRWRSSNQHDFWSATAHMCEEEFMAAFRMGRRLFSQLLHVLLPRISVHRGASCQPSTGAVSPAVRLACALRMLDGATIINLTLMFAISRPSLYRILYKVSNAICEERGAFFAWYTARQ